MIILKENNLLLDCEAQTKEAVIRQLVHRFAENGCTDEGYADAVLERERQYPTGLPTEDVFTALPHAAYPGIYKTAVAVARLRNPIDFQSMDGSEELLPVKLVFLLANASGGDAHLEDLQELMDCFSREGFLQDLAQAEDAAAFVRVFARKDTYQQME